METANRTLTEETNYTIDALIPLDADGRIDDFADGEYGYQVFCDIGKDEAWFAQFGLEAKDDFVGGQLEFNVDKNGNLKEDDEILLWITTGNDEDGYTNEDFVSYSEPVPQCVIELVKSALNDKNTSEENIDLGEITVDVQLQSNGKYDVYISTSGCSGSHYADVTSDDIGRLVADAVECEAEA